MKGLLFTSVTGAKYWVDTNEPQKTFAQMGQASWQYGPGWGKPGSKVEFGEVRNGEFELIEQIQTGWDDVAVAKEPVPQAG